MENFIIIKSEMEFIAYVGTFYTFPSLFHEFHFTSRCMNCLLANNILTAIKRKKERADI